jgi:hypothetical protein
LRQYCTLSLPCAQWWLSSWELHGFARQYASLAVQQGLRFVPLRFEARPCPAPTSGGPCVFSMLERDGTTPAALNASQHQRCALLSPQDLQSSFNATARRMLEAIAERLPQLDVEWMLGEVQVGHPGGGGGGGKRGRWKGGPL